MSPDKSEMTDDTVEKWESGELGTNPDYAEKAPEIDDSEIDEALELQPISIRLEKSLIEDFKAFSRIYGVGYQPLIRQVLHRFAEGEKKMLFKQHLAEHRKFETQEADDDNGYDNGADEQNVA